MRVSSASLDCFRKTAFDAVMSDWKAPFQKVIRAVSFCLLAVSLPAPSSAPAQSIKSMLESFGGGAKPAASELSMADQLEWAKAQLAVANSEEKNEAAIQSRIAEAGLPALRIEDFRSALADIQRNLRGGMEVIADFPDPLAKSAGPGTVAPPVSEQRASEMREAMRRSSVAAQSAQGEIELISRLISQYQALQANTERETRQLGEEAATVRNPEAKARVEVQLALANLQKRAAESAVFFGKWKVAQQELLAQQASSGEAAFRSALRAGGFDRQLDARRAGTQIEAINAEAVAAEKALSAALKEQTHAGEEAAAYREKSDSPAAAGRSAAADTLAYTAQRFVSALEINTYLLAEEKSHWNTIKEIAADTGAADLKAAIAKSEELIARQRERAPNLDRRMLEAREGLAAAQRQLRAGIADPAIKSLVERTVALAQKRVEALGSLIMKSGEIISTQEEFLAELQTVLGQESTSRRASRAWENVSRSISDIWHFELFSMGNNSISVGKVLSAALGLLLALLCAGWLSRWTSRTATRRFQMAEDQKSLLERSVFIPVAAILVLTILYWLNIPLTVFAFLGGALAIGIGFGAQNLMNNFISGIILLLERQIKVGDIIEVAGSTGKVTHLGSRCSRIRKFDGVELLVPNSAFLEKEVTNWTLADPHHRFDFSIGVAYGSPVEKTMSLLTSALERQPGILKEPEPGVFFEAFGDSSLIFRLYYWLELGGSADARQVGSELRCRIERDLRAAGIEMPFPQRDLNFKSAGPIPVLVEMATPTSSQQKTP